MSTLNPYAPFLANLNPILVLADTPTRLAGFALALTPEQLETRRAPGKWSPREILAHLADCELVFAFRLRQTLAIPNPIIQPFDQDAWAQRYRAYDVPTALTLFANLRAWNLALLTTVSPAEHTLPTHHPERGQMTFQTILETMAGHDLNHLQQLESISAI